ncbi:nucleotidyltransferase family protein [Flavobacterium sp.]|jgi:predicted nucleotidyltransferase|uniref:nucleotidyltransferase family protein n=1 Tax=Flavobacterium sp. TaxID=239 RepID=UPI0037C170F7
MLNSKIKKQLPMVIELLKKHKIKSAFVFGSVLTDAFNDASDIDFLVNLEDGIDPVEAGGHLWDLEYELQDLFDRKIDLLTERSLKNPYFIAELNKTKFSIYG